MRNAPMVTVECDGCGREALIEIEENAADVEGYVTTELKEARWSVSTHGDFCPDCPNEGSIE